MVPNGGKKQGASHPGLIPLIAEAIAKLKQVPVEDVFAATREATRTMYGI